VHDSVPLHARSRNAEKLEAEVGVHGPPPQLTVGIITPGAISWVVGTVGGAISWGVATLVVTMQAAAYTRSRSVGILIRGTAHKNSRMGNRYGQSGAPSRRAGRITRQGGAP
jgi:hypothetical protein